MKKWLMAGTIALTVLIGLQACAPKSQDDCGFVQNVYGERISWKGQIPIKLQLHKSVPDEYAGAIQAAARSWNEAAGKTVFQVSEEKVGDGVGPTRDRRNVIYYMSTWEPDRLSEQAKTSVHWVGDQIQEADIRINAAKVQSTSGVSQVFNFYWSGHGSSGVNMEALILHELGHVLGMKHKDGAGSVMATYLASNTDRTRLASADTSALQCEY